MQDETASQNGNAMRSFALHDAGEHEVACVAFERHVDNETLANGIEVVLYVAVAQPGLHNKDGQLWLYDTCHVVQRR